MASDATAYLEVTFTKRIQKQSNFSDTALAGNFKIESTIASTTTVIPIVKAIIISNKVRLQIADADVPKQQTSITLTYTDNSGNNGVSLVDATTGFPIKDLVPVKDAVKTEVETPIGPSIVGAVVKHESPNKITLTFTEKRDVITNSLSTKDPASGNNDVKCGYGIGYNNDANFNLGDKGAYVTPTFDVNGTSSTAMNKIILTTNTGEFQYGSTVSLTGGGVENGIGDQFDLSCVEFTEFNVTNNVEQVILDGAYITNTDPSSVLLYFKKRTSDTILDISAEYISTTIPQAGVFQCEMFNIQDENHTAKYDISGVDSVKYSDTELINAGFSSTLANKYHDISGVRFMLNDWPFQYNSPVKILFDISGDVPNTCKLEDQYGNKIFNSAYDPKSGTGNDISWCTVTNNIQGIKIKSGNNLSNNTGDLSYNIILDFTTETGTSGISGELIGTPVPGEFKLIKNHGNPFEVDKAKAIVIDVSKVQIWVDYSKNTFDKIINKGETIKLQYNPTTTWPSSIKDEYGNYVRKVTEPAIDIVNNMDYSGNLPGSTSVESDGKTINFDCGFDISVNDTDSFTGTGGFTFSAGLDPTGVIVETIEKGDDDKTMKLTLSKPLYATSLPTLNYSNSSGVTFTDCYGIKLKNKTGISVSVSNIPAPGREESSWIDNSGVAYNTLGKLDLSFNPTIDSFSSDNRSGFKYQASYVEHNSTFADLSTDGYVDIPASNITFDDNTGIITLDTGFNQAGASRGFSKKHTSTDTGYGISVKYVGPDLSNNRPKGTLGYLPDFEFTMADASNNIWDPSCNPDQTSKKTAIILHDNPAQILVAMQQPTYVDSTLQWWDISNILFANDPTLEYDDGASLTYNSTTVSRTLGEGGSSGHSSTTNWINATFPADISSSTINVDWASSGAQIITDQNGGVLSAFDNKLPVTSEVKWVELVETAVGNTQCIFEQTPIVYPFISADNAKQIHVQWDPQLSDYGGMSATAFTAKHTPDGGSELTQVCTSFSSMSPPNSTENRLVLTFPNAFATTDHDIQISYTKPVGNAGIKLNYDGGRWLETFADKPALSWGGYQAGIRHNLAPGMTITSTTVTSGSQTDDATIALTFTVTGTGKKTKNFATGDITVTNGEISNFATTNADGLGYATIFTATFTPTQDGACTIDVGAGAFTDIEGDGNTAAAQFSWTKITNSTPQLSSVYAGYPVTTGEPTRKFPKRVYFTTTTALTTGPPADHEFTFTDKTPNSDGTSSFDYWTDGATVDWTNGSDGTDGFYYEGGNEWQYGASMKVAYSGSDMEDFTATTITNNVITPFYPKIWRQQLPGPTYADRVSSNIHKDEPNSVYIWFMGKQKQINIGATPNIVQLHDNGNTITNNSSAINSFKFVTKDKDDAGNGYPVNIIDVSAISIVTVDCLEKWGWTQTPLGYAERYIPCVKFDLSRNEDPSADISSVNNPYSFTSRDEIYLMWDQNRIADNLRLVDASGNELFDSSANKTGIVTDITVGVNDDDVDVDINGTIASTTRTDFAGANSWLSGENYYGLEVLASSTGGVGANLGIRDIVLQSAEMLSYGVTSKEIASADKQRLVLRFQTDVSFNEKYYGGGGLSWSNTDISANDWVIEISGNRPTGWNGWDAANNGQWVDISYALGASNNTTQNANCGYEINTKYSGGTDDPSYNAISMTLRTSYTANNEKYAAWYGDDLRVKMKNMNNKPLGRQYIDISGQKLIPYNVNYVGSNAVYFPITNDVPQLTFDISEGTFSWDPIGGGEAFSDVVARWDQDISQNWTGTLSQAFKNQFSIVWKDSGGNNISFDSEIIQSASVSTAAYSGGALSLQYMLIGGSQPASAEFTYTRDGANGLVNFRTDYANNASSFSLDFVS